MIRALSTLFFWCFFMLSGAIMQLVLMLSLAGMQDINQRQQTAQKFRFFWSAMNLWLFFRTPSLRGLSGSTRNLPPQFILVANHRSNLDPLFVSVIGRPLVFLSKKSILKTPVIGWWMRLCGDVPVDRGEKVSREQSLNDMRERLDRGDSLLIFPEGTRQTDSGVPLGPFKDGAFNLAARSGVPIVALVLDRTDTIWTKGSYLLNLQKLKFSISDALPTKDRDARELKEECLQIMHSMIHSLTQSP